MENMFKTFVKLCGIAGLFVLDQIIWLNAVRITFNERGKLGSDKQAPVSQAR